MGHDSCGVVLVSRVVVVLGAGSTAAEVREGHHGVGRHAGGAAGEGRAPPWGRARRVLVCHTRKEVQLYNVLWGWTCVCTVCLELFDIVGGGLGGGVAWRS